MQTNTVKIQLFNTTKALITNSINPRFMIVNTGTMPLNMSNVKIRYYYSFDIDKEQNFYCDWASVGNSNVKGNFFKTFSNLNGSKCYLEMSFLDGAGVLAPGANAEIHTRIAKADWSNYNQSEDYSFNNLSNSYIDWTKVTVYISGKLAWGIEPSSDDIVPQKNKFLIIVSSPLYKTGLITNSLNTYLDDISKEGWAGTVIKVNDVSDEGADYITPDGQKLKEIIKNYYMDGYKGFVFIGSAPSIPTVYWKYDPKEDIEKLPSDLFYTDTNDWFDIDSDGVYQTYSRSGEYLGKNFGPELFYGRISAGSVSKSIYEEAMKVSSYLDKVHKFRTAGSNLSFEQRQRALVFLDSDWQGSSIVADYFKSTLPEIHIFAEPALVNADKLCEELEKGYYFATIASHANNYSLQLGESYFTLQTLKTINPNVHYLNIFGCGACNYTSPNLGATFLFDNDHIYNVSGTTGYWGFFGDSKYYEDIMNKVPVGIAFRDYFKRLLEEGGDGIPKGVLLGDPTLRY